MPRQTNEIIEKSAEIYGLPVKGSLQDHIDHGNIHGWLQERIHSVEGRLAFTVTELLKQDKELINDFAAIYESNGKEVMRSYERREYSPQDLFTIIFDNMLEGMPCDRVNEIAENTASSISWRAQVCLHNDFWAEAGGNIDNFYILRDSWIKGFLSESVGKAEYIKTAEGINIVRRV